MTDSNEFDTRQSDSIIEIQGQIGVLNTVWDSIHPLDARVGALENGIKEHHCWHLHHVCQ